MTKTTLIDRYDDFLEIANPILENPKYHELKKFYQHNHTSVYSHSISVAYRCYHFAITHPKWKLNIDNLVIAGLLHDYFLYDWHDKKKYPRKGLHGFTHPKVSVENAIRDFNINKHVQRIIRSHMFPLTLFHFPTSREAWVLTMVDKKCAIQEMRNKNIK